MPGASRTDRWQRILVADADEASLSAISAALEAGGYHHLTATTDPGKAARLVCTGTYDLLLTDRSFPDFDGFDLMRIAHSADGRLPVLITTSDNDVATAVEALRRRAADFLVKPIETGVLVERVDRVLRDRAGRRGREVVLAIGAHPDDVEIGCGAALLAHRARGDRVAILVMSGGERGGMALVRRKEAAAAADLLGAELFVGTLEDTKIPDHGPAVDLIEGSIASVAATRIYTHSSSDHHQDHRNTNRAAMIASRRVPRLFGFQSPSATIDYRPTRFEAIDDRLAQKLELIACHRSQSTSRDYLEEDFITATARYWGRFGTSRYAEAFEVLRDVHGDSAAASLGAAGTPDTHGHKLALAGVIEQADTEEYTEAV